MTLGRFWRYNVLGAVAWVVLFVASGYFFGTVPWVEGNLTIVILAIVGVSVVPLAVKAGRSRWGSRSESTTYGRKEGSMDCPVCGERLKEIDRSGVMVDICPSCKGIWLDRGEIDKIIGVEAKQGNVASSARSAMTDASQEQRDDHDHDDHKDHDDDQRSGRWTRRFGQQEASVLVPAGHPRRPRRIMRPGATDDPTGLSPAEAGERLRTEGFNELPSGKNRGLLAIALGVIREPMFLLLVFSGALYATLGDLSEASMLLGFVLVVMGITVYQERKTERALEALRDLSSPRAV